MNFSHRHRFLHYLTLSTLALGGPLLNIIADGPEFLINRRLVAADIAFLVAGLLLALPFSLSLIGVAVGIVSKKLFDIYHATACGILAFLAVVPLLSQQAHLSGEVAIGLGIGLAVTICLGLLRKKIVGQMLFFLSPIALISVISFVSNPGIGQQLFGNTFALNNEKIVGTSDTPVVMVVFDEFSLNSLLKENLEIDELRYPNFSAFANQSHWFRNATSVSQFTPIAVPAILSGKFPASAQQLPTTNYYPENIFTLLRSTHEIQAYEPFTRLCPEQLCKRRENKPLRQRKRLEMAVKDLVAVYLNYAVPGDIDAGVPDIDGKWGDLWEDNAGDWLAPNFSRGGRVEEFRNFIGSIRASEHPTLYFSHIIIPHMPHQFMPSGKMCAQGGVGGYVGNRWLNDDLLIENAYQRYVLQVGTADTLLGELIAKLKQLGLYDKALIVVAADHGVSFQPETYRRGRHDHPSFYEDVMSVPLFIKLPDQAKGVIDERNAQTIDILPSILDALKLKVSAKFDGHSLFQPWYPSDKGKRLLVGRVPGKRGGDDKSGIEAGGSGFVASYTMPDTYPMATIDWKYRLPGYRNPPEINPYYIGRYPELIGKPVTSARTSTPIIGEVSLQRKTGRQDSSYESINFSSNSKFSPAHIRGVVEGEEFSRGMVLGVALNGIFEAFAPLVKGKTAGTFEFSSFVPEKSFVEGENKIEVFLVSGEGESTEARLVPFKK